MQRLLQTLVMTTALASTSALAQQPVSSTSTVSPSTTTQNTASNGYYPDGNDLLKRCTENIKKMDNKPYHAEDRSWCLGFIQGYESLHLTLTIALASKQIGNKKLNENEINAAMTKQQLFCPPETITLGDMARVVVKYLETHSDQLNKPAGILTTQALVKEYPCKN